MRVVEVRTEAELDGLRPVWNEVLRGSAANTIFLTWEWIRSWWSAYGRPGDLRILLGVGEDAKVRAIAPLRAMELGKYGRKYRALTFVGAGSADSDYQDIIVARGHEGEAVRIFTQHLDTEIAAGTLLKLDEIPESSPTLAALREFGSTSGMLWAEEDSPCAVTTLGENWETYLKMLAPRFRTKIRSVLRNIEARSDVRFYFCDDAREIEKALGSLFDLHAKRWAREAKPGVFRGSEKRHFYKDLSASLAEQGWLRFSALEWKGRMLACQYGFVYDNRYSQLQEGYEPESEHWSPGVALRAWSIQRFLNSGIREYDFLGGLGRHKSDWGGQTRLSKRVVIARRTPANILFCRGGDWIVQIRQAAKQRVPKHWLAARDARQEQRRIEAYRKQTTDLINNGRARDVLAGLYYYSGAGRIARPMQVRYRLQYSPGSHHAHLSRRIQPSIRIVYYHRINNEGDPFFPATSAAQFEREIAFITRNYRIVSLTEAVRRLVNGEPAEPAIVITFDDGYEDNHRVALPILMRYGTPATIFLATGSLDTREPLWFEQLAQAVKTSPHTSIDLELEIPVRLPLRDQAERLRANDRIYFWLRNMADRDRKEALTEIVRQLGSKGDDDRRDRMLTWDQVRLLGRHGIEFGGHTVTHPFVSRLDEKQAAWEIAECKRRIEDETQRAVEHFAYPSGREIDFSQWNKDLLKQAGYKAAVSTLWGANGPCTDRMELRRGQPWETDPAVFAAKLDWYQWIDG